MNYKTKIKEYFGDLTYSILGLVTMNGTIQLILYPFLQKYMGADAFGTTLSLISIISIMASTFGTAANYSKLIGQTKQITNNGDYNIFLIMIAVVSLPVCAVSLFWTNDFSIINYILFYLLMILTIFRYYSDVEFRLTLNYKGYFIYYLLISLGYIGGIILYYFTHSWMIAMTLGEFLPVLYVFRKGHIFKAFFARSTRFKENINSIFILSGTNLIGAIILNADRLLLNPLVGSAAVTIFYVASLVGKMISLISVPLNSVIMGHLVKYKGKLSSKNYSIICCLSIILGLIISAVCVGFSHIFVKIMYPDVYELARPYFAVANAGQVFYFISNTLTVILLRFTKEKYQLLINVFYLIIFIAVTLPMVYFFQLWGMAIGLLIVNLSKILIIMIIGMVILKRQA